MKTLRTKDWRRALMAVPLAAALIAPHATTASADDASNAAQTDANSQPMTWKPVKVPIGGGETITVEGPPHIAYFPAGDNDTYLTVRNAAIEAAVKKIPGATLTVFDANWVASKQRDMIENAISSKKFNAFIVDSDDSNAECNILTKDAPAANIAVVNVSTAICGLYLKPDGHDQAAQGTIGAIGNSNILAIRDYLRYMHDKSPGPQNVIVLTGYPLHPLTPEIQAALDIVKKDDPDMHIVADVTTNFSTIDGYNKTAPLLLAHPDTTIIFSAYADITIGAVKAVKAAGLLDKIKIYDQFGDKAVVDDIKQGLVTATTGGYPVGSADAAVSMIRDAFEGKPFSRIVLGDGGPVPADPSKWSGVSIIDKSNLATYNPEY